MCVRALQIKPTVGGGERSSGYPARYHVSLMMIVWLKLRELGRVPPLTTATRLFAILGPDQRLLISEDVALLQSAFKAQQELNSLTAAHSCQASLLNPIM